MKYWLTTHWPPRADGVREELGVWLLDGKAGAANGMASGDGLLVYQFESGRVEVETRSDGSTVPIERTDGAQGIVTLARMSSELLERPGSTYEQYTDGSRLWWRYLARATAINTAGFVPRAEVAAVLGYAAGYVFRGYGRESSGLGELTPQQFGELTRRFTALAEAQDTEAEQRAATACQRGGLGGEGAIHLALKSAIAARPADLLGEPGLTLWRVEYPLPTGDRIDVVLKDRFGRFVVVEIEVDCDETELVGPMQCMKYRALMSYLHDRDINEVRSMLVARSLDGTLKRRCERHGIECHGVTTFDS